MKYTIEDLREGRCAVKNDGTLEELNKVLSIAFTDYVVSPIVNPKLNYKVHPLNCNGWIGANKFSIPSQSVKDFLLKEEEWTPKFGERVLVKTRFSLDWKERIFIAKIPRSTSPFACVYTGHESTFVSGKDIITSNWSQIKRLPRAVEMTLEQVCKELGREIKIVKE